MRVLAITTMMPPLNMTYILLAIAPPSATPWRGARRAFRGLPRDARPAPPNPSRATRTPIPERPRPSRTWSHERLEPPLRFPDPLRLALPREDVAPGLADARHEEVHQPRPL